MRAPERSFALAAALLGLTALAGCLTSVPADPGRNAALRSRPEPVEARAFEPGTRAAASVDEDPAAGDLYARRCAQCHEPFAPQTFSASEWPMYVDRYGPRAGLFGQDRQRVLRWLQAHAR